MDYGFGRSHAAAHLHVVLPDDTLITIAEVVKPHFSAIEFAQEVVRCFVAPETGGQRRKIIATYLDPSCFNETGFDAMVSIGTQMNSIFAPYGIGAIKAANDRIGGWQLMYQMLTSGRWKIADTCPRTIEAIQTRIHDEKRPGDVQKVPGDLLDDVADACRYGVFNWFTAAEKPQEIVMREAVQGLDLQSASVRWAQMKAQDNPNGSPARLGRRGGWRR